MLKKTISLLALSLAYSYSSHAAIVVYSEDFSSTTLPNNNTQGRLGFFNQNIDFEEVGVAANSSINSSGQLVVNTTNDFRGIGIAIDPATFQGAGSYQLSFDIVSFDAGANGNTIGTGSAQASIFSGSGFADAEDRNSLILNAQRGTVVATGTASAIELATQTFTNSGNQSVSFDYDGSSAIVLFIGVNTDSFPFPTAIFDNISISTTPSSSSEAIPEPSSLLLLSASSLLFLRRKRS